MKDQAAIDPYSVRKIVNVKAAPEIAWREFTEKIGVWWPLAMYKIGKASAIDAVIEPYVGGRWYERGDDGGTCDWGGVLSWEPPSWFALSWDISADWQPDPALKTEIEVRFIAAGKNATRVDLSTGISIRMVPGATRCAASSKKEIGDVCWRHSHDWLKACS